MGNAKNNAQTQQQWHLKYVPIGINVSANTRKKFDSMGDVDVPVNQYWSAQTQSSLIHFSIGKDRIPNMVTEQQFNEIFNSLNMVLCRVGGA